MVEFGKTLLSKQNEDWKEYYIDYGYLKAILKLAIKARNNAVVVLEEQEAGAGTTHDDNDDHDVGPEGAIKATSKRSHRKQQSSSIGDLIELMQSSRHSFSSKTTTRQEKDQQQQHRQTQTTIVDEGYLRALEFRQALEKEIEKIALFLLTREGRLAEKLYSLSKERATLRHHVSTVLHDFWDNNNNTHGGSSSSTSPPATTTTPVHATNGGFFTSVTAGAAVPSRHNNNNVDSDSDIMAACWADLDHLTTQHRTFAQEMLQFVEFVELNVTALRKILKKHDKNFPHNQMSAVYLQRATPGDVDAAAVAEGGVFRDSHVDQLYNHNNDGGGGMGALVVTLRRAFAELHWVELNLLAVRDAVEDAQERLRKTRSASVLPVLAYGSTTSYAQQQEVDTDTLEESPVRTYKATPKFANQSRKEYMVGGGSAIPAAPLLVRQGTASSRGAGLPLPPPPPPPAFGTSHTRMHRRMSSIGDMAASLMQIQPVPSCSGNSSTSSRYNPFAALSSSRSQKRQLNQYQQLLLHHPTSITQRREPVLDQIQAARSRLRQSTKYAELVAAQAGIFDRENADDQIPDETRTPASQFTAAQRTSSFLNLCSSFLYMTNYYVVAPTVGEYAVKLGSTEAMAGIIIGMTPNAALLATFLYGWWSNYSYRHALIFAASCSVVGNICFALALHYDSLALVLVGRFCNGFGSARSINRRYIADTFSKADRTAASANFVTSGALGMAAGPAIAFALGNVNFSESSTLLTNVNAPGWVMLGLWSMFLVAAILVFEEPDRSNLYKDTSRAPVAPVSSRLEFGTVPSSHTAVVPTDVGRSDERAPLILHGKQSDSALLQGGDGTVPGKQQPRPHEPSKPQFAPKKEPPIWRNASVMISLWLYFVLKLVLELLLSSTATVTKFYFAWTSKSTGLFMALVALLMFPVNIGVAKLSQHYEDRELILWALAALMVSVVGIMNFALRGYSVVQYVTFSVGCFVSANSLEGPNMSLLGKTIPMSWAKSTFNSGFLSTEAGTLARSVGDDIISTVAGTMGIEWLLNGTFLPLAVLCGVSLLLVRKFYDQLIEADDDDTESIVSAASGSTHHNDGNSHVSFSDYDAVVRTKSSPRSFS